MNSFEKQGFVYILASYKHGTLYTGVTSDLINRMYEHKAKLEPKSFAARYRVDKLVYYEILEDIELAIFREKQIKNLVRRKKIILIEKNNPNWNDLSDEL